MRSACLLILSALALLAGCGVPGAPLPPSLQLPRPVQDLRAVRTGNRVRITFRLPSEATDRQRLKRLGEVRILACRSEHQEDCQPYHDWKAGTLRPDQAMDYTGDIPPPDHPYMQLEVLNDRGRQGQPAVAWVPTGPAWPTPQAVGAQLSFDAVTLHIQPGAPAPSASSAIYRIVRTTANLKQPEPLADIPADRTTFRDTAFEWQQQYTYEIRTVNRATSPSGAEVEFLSGAPVTASITTTDTFAPAVPSGLVAVFNPTTPGKPSIDLNWDPNGERDLAGYFVYRNGAKITPQPLKIPAFRDQNVHSGEQYSYQLSAIDIRGNESQRSTPVTERVPQMP